VHNSPHPCHPPYEAVQGYLRDGSIMILRKFYLTENNNGVSLVPFRVAACPPIELSLLLLLTDCAVCVVAPTPRSKANRVLKTAIPPVNVKSLPGSVGELEVLMQGTKAQSARADAFAAVECQRHTTVTRAMPETGSSMESTKQ